MSDCLYYVAHSQNAQGDTHSLKDHLEGVQERIGAFSHSGSLRKALQLAALLHDLGKYLPAFQNYLEYGGQRGSVPHARWGALLARSLGAEEVSFAVDGHHAGLPDAATWAKEHTYANEKAKAQLLHLVSAFLNDTGIQESALLALQHTCTGTAREKDVITRFLFSCLTDADWLDTEAHFSPETAALRETRTLDADTSIALVDAALAGLETTDSPINILRTSARLKALSKAHLPPGFFSLNLPTGLGKTLTSFRWALEHARHNGLERVIIVLPYTNIIDQTALRLKEILGPDAVLEHHAAYVTPDDPQERENLKKLACENWDYPVIVTTSVQFFETLFSNSPSRCRKFRNIRRSVVILDEVQTLGKNLVLPTLDMLQDMHAVLGVSFVFCTATMPAFGRTPAFPGIADIIPLADNAEALFAQTRRVRFSLLEDLRSIPVSRLENAIHKQQESTLVVCNTKGLALRLYASAQSVGGWDRVCHLSTSMCPHHRKTLLRRIAALLKEGTEKILVLATQLVEAGVDLDFPLVFRELAPLESIIQAAGRCNREGRLANGGTVTLFLLDEARYPDRFYRTQSEHVRSLLREDEQALYVHKTFHDYYAQVMALYVRPEQVTARRESRDFASAARMYRLIDDNTRSLFIWDYNDDSKKLYATIEAKGKMDLPLSRQEFRQIQQYSVQVYEGQLHNARGLWEESPSGVMIWYGGYDPVTGLKIQGQITDILIA